MNKYNESKIYKIVCSKTNNIYIGSTIQKYLCSRLAGHKNRKTCMCKDFINPKIFLLEKYNCNSLEELKLKENEYINKIKCVNKRSSIPMDIKKWKEKNKEKFKQYGKEYRKNNKEKIKECQKKWYMENKERLKQKKDLKRKNDI